MRNTLVAGWFAAALAAPAFAQSLEATLGAYIASIKEMTATLAQAKDPASAKTAQPKFDAAVAKFKATGAKFQAVAAGTKPDDKAGQAAMQKLMPEMQTAMQRFGAERQRVMEKKEIEVVLHQSLAKAN